MKKFIVILLLILATILALFACAHSGNGGDDAIVIEGISVSVFPHKNKYFIGQEVDLTGGRLTVYYSDGEYDVKSMENEVTTEYNFSKAGSAKVTIDYMGYKADFSVTVEETKVSKVKINKAPDIIDCINSKINIDSSSGIVTVYFNDGNSIQKSMDDSEISTAVSGYIWNLFTSELKATMTVECMGVTDSCNLMVQGVNPDYIDVVVPPGHKTYFLDGIIDVSGGVVVVGSSRGFSTNLWLTNEHIKIEYDFSTVGTSSITAQFGELTNTFKVKVLPTIDWNYMEELFEIMDLALDFSHLYAFDSEFLYYYFKISDQVNAILSSKNTEWISKYTSEYSVAYAEINDYYSRNFRDVFSLFQTDKNFEFFLEFYTDAYYNYFIAEYVDDEDFINEAENLMDMFFALNDEELRALFLTVRDSAECIYYISDDYYSKYMISEDERDTYYYLFWAKFYYAIYLYDENGATLDEAMDYMLGCINHYQNITDTTIFDSYFARAYSEFAAIYKNYEALRPEGYDWINLRKINRDFLTAYNNNNYVLMTHCYNVLVEERLYFESIKTTKPEIYKYYSDYKRAVVENNIELFNTKLKKVVPELFEDESLEFINYFSAAAYSYVNGCRGSELLEMVQEIDRLHAEMSAIQKSKVAYYLSRYWYYFRDMHWDAYRPDILTEEEMNIYASLLSAVAYYTDCESGFYDEDAIISFLLKFKIAMETAQLEYSRLSPQAKENFNEHVGEYYRYWIYIFHSTIFPDF